MKRICVMVIIILSVCMTGCSNQKSKIDRDRDLEKETINKMCVENYLDEAGGITWLNVVDYSQLFDNVYEWTEGVKLPIDKPSNMKIELTDFYLQISEYESTEFEKYIEGLEGTGYTFRKYEEVKEMLGEEHADSIVLEIAYESVYEKGYCEFIVIPPAYFYITEDMPVTYYVIANDDGIVLCEEEMWNEDYPMSVVLRTEGEKQELYINRNDLPGSRSGAMIYPMLHKYELREGKFVEVDKVNLTQEKIIIGKLENNIMKYYEMKKNEEYDLINGRRTYWIIDKEYEILN